MSVGKVLYFLFVLVDFLWLSLVFIYVGERMFICVPFVCAWYNFMFFFLMVKYNAKCYVLKYNVMCSFYFFLYFDLYLFISLHLSSYLSV